MLFSEVYGSYFNVVAAVLDKAVSRSLTGKELTRIVQEKAFSESVLSIPAALKEDWPLLQTDLTTPIRHTPSMPLTTLQKRWLKALLQDPRISLFQPDPTGLEDVEPLFDVRDVIHFDQYQDGDPFEDEGYITVFRQLLTATRECRKVRIQYQSPVGTRQTIYCVPHSIEYSEKDDKFRILAVSQHKRYTINVARISRCELLEPCDLSDFKKPRIRKRSLSFQLTDERNALERVLLHFSHLEKETVRLGEREYRVTLWYDKDDETELLIRILSFGPMIRVIEPESFVELVRERIAKQFQLQNAMERDGL